jgi:hypothetical protein
LKISESKETIYIGKEDNIVRPDGTLFNELKISSKERKPRR